LKKSFKSYFVAILACNLVFLPVLASDNEAPHPKVALALGGGGVRGAAHIGVLRVLEREGIPIDYVVGNSMGAVVGGLHCANVPLDKIQSVLSDGSLVSAYLPRFLWCRILFGPVRNVFYMGRDKPYAGLVSGEKLKAIIDGLLPDPNMKVEDLKVPFSSIAVNLIDGQAHVLSEGRLDDVLRASATIPLLLRPVPIGGNLYVDGGIRNNLPTGEARRSGADIVISVEIDNDMKPVAAKQFTSYRTVFDRVMNATLEQLDEDKVHGADIVVRPELVNIPILSKDWRYVDEAVSKGEAAAIKVLPRIRERLQQLGIALKTNP
jgi:NTE family protein